MPILEITSRERSTLRAAAHPLHPVVLIGDNGLSDAVLKEIDLNLNAHSLIKVRANSQDRDERDVTLGKICDTLSCAAVHHLGKMLILYRPSGNGILPTPGAKKKAEAPKRKPSEPHTPKKMAALGKTLTKRDTRSPRKSDDTPVEPTGKRTRAGVVMLNAKGKPARPTHKPAPAPSARRAGSALSLRAGARNGIVRTTSSKKPDRGDKR
jgi:RNA-binding protein